ncbi:MAG: hypothetical protein M3N19_00240 [Candidatus Eremiobacteraeota bacterium]|nr:hypothetical protein [Candidatus Eremiobacteraeota bacterium]
MVHLILAFFFARQIGYWVAAQGEADNQTIVTTSMRLERRSVAPPAKIPPRPKVEPVLRQPPPVAHTAVARPRPHELARQTALAPPQPPPVAHPSRASSLAAQLTHDQELFSKTISQLRGSNNPLTGTQNPGGTTGARHYKLNLNGRFGEPHAEGYLTPLDRFRESGARHYYFVRYEVEYADGSQERGDVPWEISFPANDDPFLRDQHNMPLPGPPSTFVGDVANMSPLIKNCYDHRYASCPIEHE